MRVRYISRFDYTSNVGETVKSHYQIIILNIAFRSINLQNIIIKKKKPVIETNLK